jgi:acetyl esterase
VLVYYHGGGMVVCDVDTHDCLCRLLACAAGVRVLSVDYRLAPEHRFPAAYEDAWTAYRYAAADGSRVAVGGDSAGGNLAAGVALRAAGDSSVTGPAFQLLFYPWLDMSFERRSYELFGEGFYLSRRDMAWYRSHYLGGGADTGDVRCSPLLAESVAGVAPAYIATAGFDPLRDEGEEYAERLRAAGVRVALRRHSGLVHGFANWLGVGRTGREAVLEAAGALRLALAD